MRCLYSILLSPSLVWRFLLLLCGVHGLAGQTPRILLFTETAGFRHASIPAATSALTSLAEDTGFAVDTAGESGVFTAENLSNYAAVVFLLTSGDVLSEEEQTAFEAYIRKGGGYMGVHSASDTEYTWPWYGQLIGAYFADHPQPQTAVVRVEDQTHPSTRHLPEEWERFDEWYNFRSNPRPAVHVLMTLDESTYTGGSMGDDHPIAWYHEFEGGRSWYTGGGHTIASYEEADFVQHLRGGLLYAAFGLSPELRIHEWNTETGMVNLRLAAGASQQYDLYQSSDLSTWTRVDTFSIGEDGAEVEFQHAPASGPGRFFRVEASAGE